jgi:hypothetical protein
LLLRLGNLLQLLYYKNQLWEEKTEVMKLNYYIYQPQVVVGYLLVDKNHYNQRFRILIAKDH